MDEQNSKVHHKEVCEDHAPALCAVRHNVLAVAVFEKVRVGLGSLDGVLGNVMDHVAGESGGQDVRPAHEPVAEVVDVARCAPPSGDEKARASSGLDILEMLDARVVGVGAEAVLLVVDGTEDVVADTLDCKDGDDALEAKIDRVDGEVTGLETVCEGNPDQVAERQHHSKTISDEVDGSQDGGLHVQGVECVDSLGGGDQDDRVGDTAVVAVLLHDEGKVHDDPAKHTGAQLTPRLDVDLTEDRKYNTGVQLAADEPVVEDVAGVATSCKLAHARVLGVLDAEGADIDVGSQEVGDQDVGGQDTDVVVGDEGPYLPVGTIHNGASAQDGYGEER